MKNPMKFKDQKGALNGSGFEPSCCIFLLTNINDYMNTKKTFIYESVCRHFDGNT